VTGSASAASGATLSVIALLDRKAGIAAAEHCDEYVIPASPKGIAFQPALGLSDGVLHSLGSRHIGYEVCHG